MGEVCADSWAHCGLVQSSGMLSKTYSALHNNPKRPRHHVHLAASECRLPILLLTPGSCPALWLCLRSFGCLLVLLAYYLLPIISYYPNSSTIEDHSWPAVAGLLSQVTISNVCHLATHGPTCTLPGPGPTTSCLPRFRHDRGPLTARRGWPAISGHHLKHLPPGYP